jgi:hypothetical protein
VTNASRLQEKHSQHDKEESGKESLAMGRVNVAADLDSEQQLQPLPNKIMPSINFAERSVTRREKFWRQSGRPEV